MRDGATFQDREVGCPLFIVLIAVICSPIWNSFLQGIMGTVCTWIFGIGDHYIWATVCVVLSFLLLAVGGYGFLEKAQLVILGAMVVAIFVAVFYLRPDWLAINQRTVFTPIAHLSRLAIRETAPDEKSIRMGRSHGLCFRHWWTKL